MITILAIDDDPFIQKVIKKALISEQSTVIFANSGEQGIEKAPEINPDIIILDVEMPGINGYETCQKLRQLEVTKHIPVIFLSAHSSLEERMKGYEVGGDDYLSKPFEADNLKAKIAVLSKFQHQRKKLVDQYQMAQQAAVTALTGSSELGLAMQFLEKSLSFDSLEALMCGLFECAGRFDLGACAMVRIRDDIQWFASDLDISPIEKELLEMSDHNARFVDFGHQTIVNYPRVSLLVRNMPIEEADRYGRMKDILPVLVSAANVKLSAIETRLSLNQQNEDMLSSFMNIRRYLYHLGATIISNRREGKGKADKQLLEVHSELLRMGLDEDQEDFLLDRIDELANDLVSNLDAGQEIRDVLRLTMTDLKSLISNQEHILNNFEESQKVVDSQPNNTSDDNIELF